MTTKLNAPGNVSKQMQGLIKGFTDKPVAGMTTMAVNGKTYTIVDLLAKLEEYCKTYENAEEAEKAHTAAVQARDEIDEDATHLVQGLVVVLKGMLGKRNVALTDYGVTPNKAQTPLTPEQEILRKAKAKATREARHTMGPKQKARIKGQVPQGPTST